MEMCDAESIACTSCIIQTDVKQLSDLQCGDHISVRNKLTYNNFFSTELKKCFYRHHAIVKHVTEDIDTQGEIEALGFASLPKDQRKGFAKGELKTDKLAINLEKHSCKIIEYEYFSFPKKVRVEFAENLIANRNELPEYCVCINNCEHFCHKVCTGILFSKQVETFMSFGKSFLAAFIAIVLTAIVWIVMFYEELDRSKATKFVFSIIGMAYYEVYLAIYMGHSVIRRRQKKKLCPRCDSRWHFLLLFSATNIVVSGACVIVLIIPNNWNDCLQFVIYFVVSFVAMVLVKLAVPKLLRNLYRKYGESQHSYNKL